ncbi:MAG: long-chain fatty acid--CoA ligase [Planctomycetes bacterium]|nr:long-chain fatty acid--CoA ligase [Planctomycetota bacterium]
MRLLKPILRKLLLGPRQVRIVDDQRSWRGLDLYVAALHMARAIERTTSREHIGFMLPTSGLCPVALLATWMLGRTSVPLNYLLSEEERAYIIDDAELDAVVTVTPMVEFAGGLPESVKQIRMDEMSFGGLPPLRRAKQRSDDDMAVLLYTSGTSGRPKGVMLTGDNLSSNVEQCLEFIGVERIPVIMGVLPQFHSFGLTALTLLPLAAGSKAVYTARFVPARILKLLQKHRPTVMIAIPSMYNALLSAKSATADHFSSLQIAASGGEPLPAAVFDGFRERFGLVLNEGYGLTETSPVSNLCRPDEHKRHSVGPCLPRVEEKIVDPDGNRLSSGAEGEVCIKGPNVMSGYFKLPDETAAVFDDEGFFRTGDMGKVDEDGHLFITGRIKEMLIIGGDNVFPREIEEVLNQHATVHASAVIGVVDESRGETAMAFVELEEGAQFDERALRAHCRERLAQFKVPREIRVIETLPRNPTGKIMRRELSAATASLA